MYNYLNDAITAFVNTGSLVAILVDTVDTLTKETDRYISDIDANELAGTGYSRKTLTNVTINLGSNGHATHLDADDIAYTGINAGEIEAAYIANNTGSDPTSKLLCRLDGANVITSGGDVTLVLSALNGVAYIDA